LIQEITNLYLLFQNNIQNQIFDYIKLLLNSTLINQSFTDLSVNPDLFIEIDLINITTSLLNNGRIYMNKNVLLPNLTECYKPVDNKSLPFNLTNINIIEYALTNFNYTCIFTILAEPFLQTTNTTRASITTSTSTTSSMAYNSTP